MPPGRPSLTSAGHHLACFSSYTSTGSPDCNGCRREHIWMRRRICAERPRVTSVKPVSNPFLATAAHHFWLENEKYSKFLSLLNGGAKPALVRRGRVRVAACSFVSLVTGATAMKFSFVSTGGPSATGLSSSAGTGAGCCCSCGTGGGLLFRVSSTSTTSSGLGVKYGSCSFHPLLGVICTTGRLVSWLSKKSDSSLSHRTETSDVSGGAKEIGAFAGV
mmetsp:Transcript_31194/g.56991  ORF Transcript_31194/g.56991 Transcript_31194/m.56991 type:complete len:219 (-) Transcript_31194:1451-2107(-)